MVPGVASQRNVHFIGGIHIDVHNSIQRVGGYLWKGVQGGVVPTNMVWDLY